MMNEMLALLKEKGWFIEKLLKVSMQALKNPLIQMDLVCWI